MFSWPDHEQILHYSQFYAGMFALAALTSGLVTFLQAWLFGLAGTKLTNRLRVMTFQNYLVQVSVFFIFSCNCYLSKILNMFFVVTYVNYGKC